MWFVEKEVMANDLDHFCVHFLGDSSCKLFPIFTKQFGKFDFDKFVGQKVVFDLFNHIASESSFTDLDKHAKIVTERPQMAALFSVFAIHWDLETNGVLVEREGVSSRKKGEKRLSNGCFQRDGVEGVDHKESATR